MVIRAVKMIEFGKSNFLQRGDAGAKICAYGRRTPYL